MLITTIPMQILMMEAAYLKAVKLVHYQVVLSKTLLMVNVL